MIFRATNESLTPGYSFAECKEYYLGYSVSLFNDGKESYVALNKDNYGRTELVRVNVNVPCDTPVELKAEAVGENIKVYLNGELVIEYADPDPFMKGAVGFSNIVSAKVSDLKAEPLFS